MKQSVSPTHLLHSWQLLGNLTSSELGCTQFLNLNLNAQVVNMHSFYFCSHPFDLNQQPKLAFPQRPQLVQQKPNMFNKCTYSFLTKHPKNCKCCPVSHFIFRSQLLTLFFGKGSIKKTASEMHVAPWISQTAPDMPQMMPQTCSR